MVYAKRGGSCCVCSFVLEVIALAAALIAITGTFWLDPITTDVGSVLPGVEHAGLWKVCYPESGVQLASPGGVSGDDGAVASDDGAVAATLFATDPGDPDADAVVSGFADDAPAATPRRAGPAASPTEDETVDSSEKSEDRLTNTSFVVSSIRKDLEKNLPWTEGSPDDQCVTITGYREMTLYHDIWGNDFSAKVDATRAMTILFVGFGFVRLIYTMVVSVCTGDYASGATCTGGTLTTMQVLAGWAGWLIYLWVLLDISRSVNAHESAALNGVRIDVDKAGDVSSYWGYSFWLFLASTLTTSIGAFFGCW